MRLFTVCAAMIAITPAAAQAPAPLRLQADTPVRLETAQPLSSQANVRGDRIALRVAEDVTVDGVVVIPKGAPAAGQVSLADRKEAFGAAGRLGIELLYATAGDRIVRLRGGVERKGGNNETGAATSSVFLTAVAVAITGKRAQFPAGTPLTGYVLRDVTFERR